MKHPSVVIADDHAIIVDGLRALLEGHADVLATYADGEALLAGTAQHKPDVVVTDISMPKLSGLDFLRAAKASRVTSRIILLSMYGSEAIVDAAIRAGAMGYLPKHAAGEELLEAIRTVMNGDRYVSPLVNAPAGGATTPPNAMPLPVELSRRQREVLQLVVAGKRMKEIAAELKLSRRTVEMHKYGMMRALGLHTTAELIRYFLRHESTSNIPRSDSGAEH